MNIIFFNFFPRNIFKHLGIYLSCLYSFDGEKIFELLFSFKCSKSTHTLQENVYF
ncbi:Hypothetical protein PYTT_2439 [Akkermansia glycaniphila]|uniref:Uncharacterized protein n=1 Tax=Akkermansia glycaniphila TaxID=1679444 RepID=A0A1H6MKW0_9BACT|nr:Hypothetical protein PYTT_2439 [Akkermansia glycaniphila]